MKVPVTIRFVSGREEKFEVELWGGSATQSRLQEFVEHPHLVLQTADELLIIPGSAIECVSIKLSKGDSRLNLRDIRPATRVK